MPSHAPLINRLPAKFPETEALQVVEGFDLKKLPPAFYGNPYLTFHVLRTIAPVHQLGPDSFIVARHADLTAIYKDAKLYSSDKKAEFLPKFGDRLLYQHHTTLIFNDPPLHTRVAMFDFRRRQATGNVARQWRLRQMPAPIGAKSSGCCRSRRTHDHPRRWFA